MTEPKKRSFADHRLDVGTASQLRNQVKEAFSLPDAPQVLGPTLNYVGGSIADSTDDPGFMASMTDQPGSMAVSFADPVNPVDYEKFVHENADVIKGDPHSSILLFPEGDVSVSTIPREYRTVQIPLPNKARVADDPLVRDCTRSFTQDWNVVGRKYGSFYGHDEQALSERYSTCKRTADYVKSLPKHQFEVDMPNEELGKEDLKKMYRQSVTSNLEYNLERAETDKLLTDLLDPVEKETMDEENFQERQKNRFPSLFGLYPLPGREDALENRTPTTPPTEHQSIKMLVKISELKFDIEIEPVFVTMALYNAREKKKISETFHLDCNSHEMMRMVHRSSDDFHEERVMASLSRSCIFSVTYPHSDIFLVLKIEKVLQQGDVGDAAEPYFRGREIDAKSLEKAKNHSKLFCKQLSQYRMPFAWAAINIVDVIVGNQSSSPQAAIVTQEGGGTGTRDRRDSDTRKSVDEKSQISTADVPRRKDVNRTSSVSSMSGRLVDQEFDESVNLSQTFSPVTLTLGTFFKQDSDKLTNEDLYRFLGDMRKPAPMIARKFKIIPGHLKMDIQPPYEGIPCCLTPNLFEVEPFPDSRNRRPIREIEEFPSREVYTPYTTFKNFLYVYPQSLDFRSVSRRNIGVKVQFLKGEDPNSREDCLPSIYGRSNGPGFLREWWCLVNYHNKQPEFYEEIKIELPPKLTENHHLLFSFYHISCQKPKPDQPMRPEPIPLGYTWMPLLREGVLQNGEFHIPVAGERLPAAYSHLSPEVQLPNLKWIDNHRGVFKLQLNIISSIYPQDTQLLSYVNHFYDYNTKLGTEMEEKQLVHSIQQLEEVSPEPLVKFLHITLNNLCTLLVRPTINESIEVQRAAFSSLAHVIKTVHSLRLPTDKHGRNVTLSSYVQYVFGAPEGPSNASAFDVRHSTASRSRSSVYEEDVSRRSSTSRRPMMVKSMVSDSGDADGPRAPKVTGFDKLFFEQLVYNWITAHPATRPVVYANSWFFFEITVKSMAQYLSRTNKLEDDRRKRFSDQYLKDLEFLISSISSEIAEKHIKEIHYARQLNTNLAFFIHDIFSLMDRGYVFSLIKAYLKKFALAAADFNLTEFKLDFLRIVCSHEHYVTLNLPLGATIHHIGANSQASSPSGSISSTFEELGLPNMEAMGDLSQEFRHYHYISGLILSELALVLDGKNAKLREQAVEVVRDLISSHDSDCRYSNPEVRSRIASIYLPLLSIVMDNFQCLYKGADGWDNLTNTFDRNTLVRRSVIIKEGDSVLEVEDVDGQLLGPVSTRNLLLCFLWVLKNIDKTFLNQWWFTLSIGRLNTMLNVLELGVACFEYRGKRNLSNSVTAVATMGSKSAQVKAEIANQILFNTARERLAARRKTGAMGGESPGNRWGKTYWQAAAEHSEKPKVDIEVDAQIESALAGEGSMIILDTIEQLMQSEMENVQSVLGKALEVLLLLMQRNQSIEVMKCIFATERAFVMKYPELIFYAETEQCAELCARLLQHCSSIVPEIRSWACASLYLLMRQNFEIGKNFARVKVQVTVALSSIVAGTSSSFNEHHLRRSLKTLQGYSDEDPQMHGTRFPEQVKELANNLHRILLDTVKMQQFQDDPEMLMDLMYRISKGYRNSPDLRLTWLQNMAHSHNERKHLQESAMCLVHAAALVAEYLYMLEGQKHFPVGCAAFQSISPNMLEESAISDDVVNAEEEGICTHKLFSEDGLIKLLEQAAPLFRESQLYEAACEVYKLVTPIYHHKRLHRSMESIYNKMAECYKQLTKKGDKRFLGTYFRVGFYGILFGDADDKEFIYKEDPLTRLGEFCQRLETLYGKKLGEDKFEILKDSNEVDRSVLNPVKGYIQVTFVEPYFEEWELKERVSAFDKGFNIKRFVYSTPYTPSGKARGDLHEQYMRKTILTTKKPFPYIKRRLRVIEAEKIELEPLEVAIINMTNKIGDLRNVLSKEPCDPKLLQMQLQGGIATSVNQGPFAIAKCFLEGIPTSEQTYLHHKLKVSFKEFTKRCQEALDKNEQLIGEDMYDYQKELRHNFRQFQKQLQPMVTTHRKVTHRGKARERALMGISSARSSRTVSQAD